METIDSRGTARPLEEAGLILATTLVLFDNLIAQRLLPAFESRLATGTLPFQVYDRRIYSADRAPDGTFRAITSEVGAAKFVCDEYGLQTRLSDNDVKIYGDRSKAELHKARQVALSLLLSREASAASLLFSSTTFSDTNLITIANGKEWGASATELPNDTAVPLTDLQAAIGRLEDRGFARERLSLTIPAKTHRILSRTKQVIDQVRALPAYANLGSSAIPVQIPGAVLAALLGVKQVIIAGGIKDTANRAKTSTFAPIWDPEKVLMSYLSEGDTDDAGLGRTIVSSEGMERSPLSAAQDLPTDAGLLFRVDTWRDENITGDWIRAREQSVQKVTNVAAGVLIDNALS